MADEMRYWPKTANAGQRKQKRCPVCGKDKYTIYKNGKLGYHRLASSWDGWEQICAACCRAKVKELDSEVIINKEGKVTTRGKARREAWGKRNAEYRKVYLKNRRREAKGLPPLPLPAKIYKARRDYGTDY